MTDEPTTNREKAQAKFYIDLSRRVMNLHVELFPAYEYIGGSLTLDHVAKEVRKLRAEVERLRGIVAELADDLEHELRDNYDGLLDYPHNQDKLERDMDPVTRARAALQSPTPPTE